MVDLEALHRSLTPIVHQALVPLVARSGRVLDMACGPGLKLPLLAELAGSAAQIIALDIDAAAVRQAVQTPLAAGAALGVVGDAHALPLRDACCATVACIASLGLFADKTAALRSMWRVVESGGALVVVTSASMWIERVAWPDDVADELTSAYMTACVSDAPLDASEDIGGELTALFVAAGLPAPHVRAWLLDESLAPERAEVALLPWAALRVIVAAHLDAGTLRRCDALARDADIELAALALVASVRR